MRTLINWLFAIIFFVAGMLQGCGTRKSAVNIDKSREVVKEQTKELVKESSTTEGSKKVEEEEKTDKEDESLNKKVTELFYENGALKERITELSKQKSTDNSSKSKRSLEGFKITQNTIEYKTVDKLRTITKYVKVKNTEQSSKNWSTMAGIVLGFGILAFFAYKWFKK